MISKSLSTSEKYAALVTRAGPLAEFCQALFPLLITHTDDYGRLQGDPFTVKHVCYPSSTRELADFASGLDHLHGVDLIVWYTNGGKRYIQIQQFDPHQHGLYRRTESLFPSPNGQPARPPKKPLSVLDASEGEIATWIVSLLKARRLVFSNLTIATIEQEVRRENAYFDILATTEEGPLILIEVKRQRVTEAAIAQVLRYQEVLGGDVVPVVIGHGVAVGEPLKHRRVLVATYDDRKRITTVSSFLVKSRHITLTHVLSEEKRTEQKGTEEKKNPPTPLRGGSRRRRPRPDVTGGTTCHHQPRCQTIKACIDRTLADDRKARAAS